MARMILILALVLAILAALGIIARIFGPAADHAGAHMKGASVSDNFKTAAYILLVLLMFGVVTGWLAGL